MMKENKTALVCLNGKAISCEKIKSQVSHVDLVIATDGGLHALQACNIKPHLVIGDMDSVKFAALKGLQVISIADQDSTDLEKAFNYLVKEKISSVIVTCMEAGRVDHFLSNFLLLWKYTDKINIRMMGEDWFGIFLRNQNIYKVQKDSIFSLIPITKCEGITLKGFQYPLLDHTLQLGEVGISNICTQDKVQIEIGTGHAVGMFFSPVLEGSEI